MNWITQSGSAIKITDISDGELSAIILLLENKMNRLQTAMNPDVYAISKGCNGHLVLCDLRSRNVSMVSKVVERHNGWLRTMLQEKQRRDA